MSAFSAADIETRLGALGEIVHACVQDGASIRYVLPLDPLGEKRDSTTIMYKAL